MKLILSISVFLFVHLAFSQNKVQYDAIYMKDGRVLFGEITSQDDQAGTLVFKERYGSTMTIGKVEYTYIIHDKKYKPNPKDTVIQVRKYNDFEFELGLGTNINSFTHQFTADSIFLKSDWESSRLIAPINVHAGFGRYIKRKWYVGMDINLGATTQGKTSFSAGLVGRFQYDNHTSNVAKYISVQLAYQNISSSINYFVTDSLTTSGKKEYPGKFESSLILTSYNIGLSHGFQFQLQFLRSLTIDVGVFKHLGTKASTTVYNPIGNTSFYRANSVFNGFGASLFLAYHF